MGLLDRIPNAAVLVRAGIFTAGFTAAACGGGMEHGPPAPTCGPCCHGGGAECHQLEDDQLQMEADERQRQLDAQEQHDEEQTDDEGEGDVILEQTEEVREMAPTCGPCCHGGGPECEQMQAP